MAMGHHGVAGLAGADLLAADHERDLDLVGGELLERLFQLEPLRCAGGVGEHGLVGGNRYLGCGVHLPNLIADCGLRIAESAARVRSANPNPQSEIGNPQYDPPSDPNWPRSSDGVRSRPGTRLLSRCARLRRSEERRVGKECRSRWSTYP